MIGGVGLRLHFDLQALLSIVFFFAGLINLPVIFTCSSGSMLDSSQAQSYANPLARTTVGNIVGGELATDSLWLVSGCSSLCCLLLMLSFFYLSKRTSYILDDTANMLLCMSDYSVPSPRHNSHGRNSGLTEIY
jgi:hypothetical protein